MQPTAFEKKALYSLLAGEHPILAALREQADHVAVRSRETSAVGAFINFEVDHSTVPPIQIRSRLVLGDGVIVTPRLQHGAGCSLFVEDGYISFLEVFTYDEPWPEDLDDAAFAHVSVPRDLSVLNPK
jgi:hypothetical protein